MRKQLTFNMGKAIAILMFLCLAMLQACRKDVLVSDSRGIQSSLSIAEAKSYFNEHIKSTVVPKKLMSTSGTGNPTNEQLLDNMLAARQPIWESAYQQLMTSGASSVKIPLDLGPVFMITDEGKKEMIPFGALNYLFMYKDSLQHIHSQWITLLPDRDWLYGNRGQYTGDIQVKTWEGALLRQFHYDRHGATTSSHASATRKVSSVKKISNDLPEPEIPMLQTVCITFGNRSKCTCINKNACDMCWQCTSNVCRTFAAGAVIPENNDPGFWGTGATGGGGSPGGVGGGGYAYYPPDYVPPGCISDPNYQIPSYPAPGGYEWAAPCGGPGGGIPIPTGPNDNALILSDIISSMGITDPVQQNFLLNNIPVYDALKEHLNSSIVVDESLEFVQWAVKYFTDNPGLSLAAFKSEFMPTIPIIANPDENNWTDPDDEILTDPDQTIYQQYQDNQAWPTVKREDIVPYEKFVPLRQVIGLNGIPRDVNCLVLAKEQLGKVGYTCSGYLPGTQTFSIYTAQNGVNTTETKKAISYIISALGQKIPVLIGVDNRPGAPAANRDNSTDHYVVIVGMGTDTKGKYFQFVDSATDNRTTGASFNNKLYYDSSTGKITGKTAIVAYRNLPGMYDYIVTQVRKSIKK